MIVQETISAIYGLFMPKGTQKEGATKFYQFLDSHGVIYGKTANYKAEVKQFFIVLDTAGNNVIKLLQDHFSKGAIIAAEKLAAKQAKSSTVAVNLPVPTLYESATAAVKAATAATVLENDLIPVATVAPVAVAEIVAPVAPVAVAPNSIAGNCITTEEYNRLNGLKRLKPEQKNALTIYQFVNGIK